MTSITKKRRKHKRIVEKFLAMAREVPAETRPAYEETIKNWLAPGKKPHPAIG